MGGAQAKATNYVNQLASLGISQCNNNSSGSNGFFTLDNVIQIDHCDGFILSHYKGHQVSHISVNQMVANIQSMDAQTTYQAMMDNSASAGAQSGLTPAQAAADQYSSNILQLAQSLTNGFKSYFNNSTILRQGIMCNDSRDDVLTYIDLDQMFEQALSNVVKSEQVSSVISNFILKVKTVVSATATGWDPTLMVIAGIVAVGLPVIGITLNRHSTAMWFGLSVLATGLSGYMYYAAQKDLFPFEMDLWIVKIHAPKGIRDAAGYGALAALAVFSVIDVFTLYMTMFPSKPQAVGK